MGTEAADAALLSTSPGTETADAALLSGVPPQVNAAQQYEHLKAPMLCLELQIMQ